MGSLRELRMNKLDAGNDGSSPKFELSGRSQRLEIMTIRRPKVYIHA